MNHIKTMTAIALGALLLPAAAKTKDPKVVAKGFFKAYDEGMSLDSMATLFMAPKAKIHVGGNQMSAAGYQQFAQAFRTGFPDGKHAIEFQVAEGKKVVTRLVFTGTHSGEFQGIAATKKSIRITGTLIDHVVNGKIMERWAEFDAMGLMQQLGAIPPMAKKAQ